MDFKKEVENLVKNVDYDPEAVKLYINSCHHEEIKKMLDSMANGDMPSSEILRILMCSRNTLELAAVNCIELIRQGIINDKESTHCVTELRLGFVRFAQEFDSTQSSPYKTFCTIMSLISHPLSSNQQIRYVSRALDILPTLFELASRSCPLNINRLEYPQQIIQDLLNIQWTAETIASLITLFGDVKPYITESHLFQLHNTIKKCVVSSKSSDFISILRCCLDLINRSKILEWLHLLRWLLRNQPIDIEATSSYFLDLSIKQSKQLGFLILEAIENSRRKSELYWQDIRLLIDLLRNSIPLLPQLGTMYNPDSVSKYKIIKEIEMVLFLVGRNYQEIVSSSSTSSSSSSLQIQSELSLAEKMTKILEKVMSCKNNSVFAALRAQIIVDLAFQWCTCNQKKRDADYISNKLPSRLSDQETVEMGVLTMLNIYREVSESRATVLSMVLNSISQTNNVLHCKEGLCRFIGLLTTTQLSALVDQIHRIQDWISCACLDPSPFVLSTILSFLPLVRLCSGFFDFLVMTMRKLFIRRDESSHYAAIRVLCSLLNKQLATEASQQEYIASCLQDALSLPFNLRAEMYRQLSKTFELIYQVEENRKKKCDSQDNTLSLLSESAQTVFRNCLSLRLLRFFQPINKASSKSKFNHQTYNVELEKCFDFTHMTGTSVKTTFFLREPLDELICCMISLEKCSSSSKHLLGHDILTSIVSFYNNSKELEIFFSEKLVEENEKEKDKDREREREREKKSSITFIQRIRVARLLATSATNSKNIRDSYEDYLYLFEVCSLLKYLEGVIGSVPILYIPPLHHLNSLKYLLHVSVRQIQKEGKTCISVEEEEKEKEKETTEKEKIIIPSLDTMLDVLEQLRSQVVQECQQEDLLVLFKDILAFYELLPLYNQISSKSNFFQSPKFLIIFSSFPNSWQDIIEKERLFPTEKRLIDKQLRLHTFLLQFLCELVSKLFLFSNNSVLDKKKSVLVDELIQLCSLSKAGLYLQGHNRVFTAFSLYFSKQLEDLMLQGGTSSLKVAVSYVDFVIKLIDCAFAYEYERDENGRFSYLTTDESLDNISFSLCDLPHLYYSLICKYNIQQSALLRNFVKIVLDARTIDLGSNILLFALKLINACFTNQEEDKNNLTKVIKKRLKKNLPLQPEKIDEIQQVEVNLNTKSSNNTNSSNNSDLYTVDSSAVCSLLMSSAINLYEDLANRIKAKGDIFYLNQVLDQFSFLLDKKQVVQIAFFTSSCRGKLASLFDKYFKIYGVFFLSLRKCIKSKEQTTTIFDKTLILLEKITKIVQNVRLWAQEERKHVVEVALRRKLATVLLRGDTLMVYISQCVRLFFKYFPEEKRIQTLLQILIPTDKEKKNSKKSLQRLEKLKHTTNQTKKRLRSRNQYIDTCLLQEDGGDAYIDLEDFIIP